MIILICSNLGQCLQPYQAKIRILWITNRGCTGVGVVNGHKGFIELDRLRKIRSATGRSKQELLPPPIAVGSFHFSCSVNM